MIEPLHLSYRIHCDPFDAFETWTERFSVWWPKSHSASGDPDSEFILEALLGGRIYERTSDGSEIEWGEVTIWEPPARLGYLWHLRRDRGDATDVVIDFVKAGDGTTRLQIVHSGWERLGVGGQEWRDANRGGWDSLMNYFRAATESADQPTEETG